MCIANCSSLQNDVEHSLNMFSSNFQLGEKRIHVGGSDLAFLSRILIVCYDYGEGKFVNN